MCKKLYSQIVIQLNIQIDGLQHKIFIVLNDPYLKKKKLCLQDVPNPVALEPCAGNKAAVLTLLVRQPTGNDRYTPHGYSGTI